MALVRQATPGCYNLACIAHVLSSDAIAEAQELYAECFPGYQHVSSVEFSARQRSALDTTLHPEESMCWLVLRHVGKLVGLATLTPSGGAMIVYNLCVHVEHRRRGLGELLLRASQVVALGRNASLLSGAVSEHATHLHRYYERLGAKAVRKMRAPTASSWWQSAPFDSKSVELSLRSLVNQQKPSPASERQQIAPALIVLAISLWWHAAPLLVVTISWLICVVEVVRSLRVVKRAYDARAFAYFRSLLENEENFAAEVASLESFITLKVAAARGSLEGSVPTEVDLVISGGGFKVCVAGGLAYTLRQLGVRVVRVAGTSAGAQLGFVVLNDRILDGLRWSLSTAQTFAQYPWAYPEPLWAHFYGSVASESPLPLPGVYTISLCQMVRWLPPLGVGTRCAPCNLHSPSDVRVHYLEESVHGCAAHVWQSERICDAWTGGRGNPCDRRRAATSDKWPRTALRWR